MPQTTSKRPREQKDLEDPPASVPRKKSLQAVSLDSSKGPAISADSAYRPLKHFCSRILRLKSESSSREDRQPKPILEHQRQPDQASPGMDSSSDAAFNKYKSNRKDLWSKEERSRWDNPAKESASPEELRAADIVVKIREHERRNAAFFGGNLPGEAVPPKEAVEMGGRYLEAKSIIDNLSLLFEIARQMPKGCHQHLHFNSEIPPERLLKEIRGNTILDETLHIRCTEPLIDAEACSRAEIVFQVLPAATTPRKSVFDSDYNGNHRDPANKVWMRWKDFKEEFQSKFPEDMTSAEDGPSNDTDNDLDLTERWVREKMVVTTKGIYDAHQTHNGVWACFNQSTRAFKGLLGYESIYRWYIGQAVDSMIADKVMYAELRPMLLDKHIPTDDGLNTLDHFKQMEIIIEEVGKKKKMLEAKGEQHKFPFGLKIIYCTPRSIPREKMIKELDDCLKLKRKFPELVCGFDLVGAEDRPNSIGYYADLLLDFRRMCEAEKLDVPFMFHAGETLIDTGGSSDPRKSNLYDALLLGARRIGHGYSLLKHPYLIEEYKKKNICLELCPISNELLHLCGNIRQHKFAELLAAGLHCTLNADNPSLFRSSLSHEFYQVMVGDPRMTIHGWKQLAIWSIEHSCLSDPEKDRALKIYATEWEIFCHFIIQNYAKRAEELPEYS